MYRGRTNEKLYHGLPKVTDKIKARRLRLARHCVRHAVKEDADSASVEVAGSLGLWEPTQGKRRVGGQHYTNVDQLMRDTGLKDVREIRSLMLKRDDWRSQKGARVRLQRPT